MRTNAIAGGRRFEPGRIGAIFAAMGAFGVLVSNPTAQQSGGTPRVRLNQIIEQFEQGRPAIANEHWVFFTLTNNAFTTIPLATARSTAWTSGSVARRRRGRRMPPSRRYVLRIRTMTSHAF